QVLAVSDTGKGIPPDELPHLFERFRRGTSRGGTGLGLAIAQRLVLAHGGQVEVDSAVGQGTTFYLLLPAAETDEERPGR
ncbi:MAG: sensor histidine kinase, partial [Anaerolineae bacterium]